MLVKDEVEELKKLASTIEKTSGSSNINIISATINFVALTYQRTPHTKAKATLTFPDGYPSRAILVNIELLPPGLSKKLQKEMENVAQNLAPQPQAVAVVQHLINFIDTNLFVPCWKELRKVVDLSQKNSSTMTVALKDSTGLIKLRFINGNYFYECKIHVNKGYPSTTTHQEWGNACKLDLVRSSFPTKMEGVLTLQAKNFVRHMQDGMSAEQALTKSNPIVTPSSEDNDTDKKGSVKEKGRAQQEKELIELYDAQHLGDPKPSLLPLVELLHSHMQQLPKQLCPVCQRQLLPTSLPAKATTKKKKSDNTDPMKSSCGCWFHYNCLHKFITEPPFGASCPTDGRQVYHPDWTADAKELERAWNQRQQRQREMDDVAMMF